MAKNITLQHHKMRGAVAVEMALLLVPLIVMAVGVAEFGRAFYQYNTVTKSVRDAVRLLSQHDPTDSNYSTYIDQAQCLVVYGSVSCSGATLLPGLSTSMVSSSTATVTTSIGNNIISRM